MFGVGVGLGGRVWGFDGGVIGLGGGVWGSLTAIKHYTNATPTPTIHLTAPSLLFTPTQITQ